MPEPNPPTGAAHLKHSAKNFEMNRRITVILSLGSIAVLAAFYVPRYLVWQNRPKTHRELIDEADRKQRADDLAYMREHAKSEDEKTLVSFWTRTAENAEYRKQQKNFRVAGGVDQFGAWILATTYFFYNFGICGVVDLPKREGDRWRVPIAVGSSARPGMIFVDARSGIITCDGHPTILDPEAYLKGIEKPNRTPEPTRPSGVAHL